MIRSRVGGPRGSSSAAVAGLVLAVLGLPGTSAAGAADRDAGLARMVGVWQLDFRVSEDPRRLLREAEARVPAPRGPEGRDKAPPQQDFDQRVKLVTEGANVLTIAHRDGVMTLTDWNDAVQALHVDGKPRAAERQGVAVEVEASWKSSDRLVVRTTGAAGGWIRETYELGGRGEKLFVTVEFERLKGSPLVFDRLYNKAGASP